MYRFYEFFAGGGMVRAGLGPRWSCLFANDIDAKKGQTYERNWGAGAIRTADVGDLKTEDLPGCADLVWASFPCQDLSLAGGGAGLKGERSGTFWPFWALVGDLVREERAPQLVVLENVCGTLTSHRGKDFATILSVLDAEGYRYGGVVIDAVRFVPQSRPRLFIIAVRRDLGLPSGVCGELCDSWHTRRLRKAHDGLPAGLRESWIWWTLPEPEPRTRRLGDLIEDNPTGVRWHTMEETERLLSMMSTTNLAKIQDAMTIGYRVVGTVYKRTRRDAAGGKTQRAEVRFDGVAGCLRTPAGGSSRQLVVVVEGQTVKSRLLSSRETARLMGLGDAYELPDRYNEAYHLTGDGVVVPVVRHLATHVLEPILASLRDGSRVAA